MSIIQVTEAMVKDYMKSFDPSHDFFHLERVRRLDIAQDYILQGKEIDIEIVELAALCHDVGDPKYYNGDISGGDIIGSFLKKHDYNVDRSDLVAKIVNHIGFRKELAWNDETDDPTLVQWRNHCLELHIVQDADKLDAIGAFGILRCAAFSGSRNICLYDPNLDPIHNMTKKEYEEQTNTKNGSAMNHFHEKLFRLYSMLRTPKGKELGKQRHEFMQLFVNQVTKEYDMQS
ncbi:hypothetical protein BJ944DRAFT_118898 [Cunninghamella echinulata]|nr:hypothetical protein BJ944DRAFT_118898 [Cunninghamella echinulata]